MKRRTRILISIFAVLAVMIVLTAAIWRCIAAPADVRRALTALNCALLLLVGLLNLIQALRREEKESDDCHEAQKIGGTSDV